MPLAYKPDWEEAKARLRAWWNHEYFGRCALAVTAPLDRPPPGTPPPEPRTPQEKWCDLDAIAARNDFALSRTFFGGEALPLWNAGYPGIASLPTMLGCPIHLDMDTGWHSPILTDPDGFAVQTLRLDDQHPAYQFHMSVLHRAVRESGGKSIPCIGAFGQSGDVLAALRGTERLLFDCVDRPDLVRDAEGWLMEIWITLYERSYQIVRDEDGGSACWMGVWAPGKTYAVANDFSCQLSPTMFRDLFLPAIERHVRYLDYPIYHLDGVQALPHLEILCAIPDLRAIQFVPGAGKGSALRYMAALQRIQRAGKNLHLWLDPAEIRLALEMLSARGLFIVTRTETEASARALLDAVQRWSVDRG